MCDLCEKDVAAQDFAFQGRTFKLCEQCFNIAQKNPFADYENYVIARALLKEYVLLGEEIQYSEPNKILKKKVI